jgi:zinc transport system substrate-binding protein
MCPGHFDLRPSQIERLASAKLCLRFDFQKGLEQKLVGRLGDDLTIKSISLPAGMCVPASYEAACRQTADILVEQGFLPKEQAGKRLEAVTARMNELSRWMRGQVNDAGLADKPVVTSFHQAEFCRALGLNVVATLTAADTARASMLDKAVEAGEREGAKLIIANRPEGRRLADVVADRLGAKVIMFGNFPENDEPEAFDRLVRANVWALTEGAPR